LEPKRKEKRKKIGEERILRKSCDAEGRSKGKCLDSEKLNRTRESPGIKIHRKENGEEKKPMTRGGGNAGRKKKPRGGDAIERGERSTTNKPPWGKGK